MIINILKNISNSNDISVYLYQKDTSRWVLKKERKKNYILRLKTILEYSEIRKSKSPELFSSKFNNLLCIVENENYLCLVDISSTKLKFNSSDINIASHYTNLLAAVLENRVSSTQLIAKKENSFFEDLYDTTYIKKTKYPDEISYQSIHVERYLLYLVKMGDVENLTHIIDGYPLKRIHTRIAKSPIRKKRDMLIAIVTLCTRSMIDANVPPSVAFDYSDNKIQQIEDLSSNFNEFIIGRNLFLDSAQFVKNNQTRGTSYFVNQAVEIIQHNLEKNYTSSEIANTLKISTGYLIKLFKNDFNCTLLEYSQKIRYEEAKFRLIDQEKPIGVIAIELGFSDSSHFSNFFRKKFGASPSAFRKKLLQHSI